MWSVQHTKLYIHFQLLAAMFDFDVLVISGRSQSRCVAAAQPAAAEQRFVLLVVQSVGEEVIWTDRMGVIYLSRWIGMWYSWAG